MRQLQLRSPLCYRTPAGAAGAHLHRLVDAAVRGGCGLVRYDGGSRSTREMVEDAIEVVRASRREGVPCLIDHRTDVALAATADGVHLVADDMPVALARRLLGPGALIGVTVASVQDARQAEKQGASYLAVGRLFPPGAGSELAPETLLDQLVGAVSLPLCGFGGITLENLGSPCLKHCALIAVRQAIAASADPQALVAALIAGFARTP